MQQMEALYVRMAVELKRELQAAAEEDLRSMAMETAYVIRLGLAERARLRSTSQVHPQQQRA